MSEPQRPTHGDWDAVLQTSQVYEAELAALRLREAGIDARLIDQSYRQEPVPSVRSFSLVHVLVPAQFSQEARRLLAQPSQLPDDPEGEER